MNMIMKFKHIKNILGEELWDRKQHNCVSCKFSPTQRTCNLNQYYANGDKMYPDPFEPCITGNYEAHSWFEVIAFIYKHYMKPRRKLTKKKQTPITSDYDWD